MPPDDADNIADIAIRRRVIVTGRVQGVWFRDTCRHVATGLELRGWVRNNADGTVELVVEGTPDHVAELVDWCHEGPPRANVTDVRTTDEPVVGESPFCVIG